MLVLLLYNFMLNYHEGGIIGTKENQREREKTDAEINFFFLSSCF
jgi:hypothetical protein